MFPTIRLLLIDDHPLVRDGLRACFEKSSKLLVVGEVGNADEAIARAVISVPDLALMDINMRGTNGLQLTAQFRTRFPHIAVLILSMYDNLEYVRQAVRAGARGYILKDAPAQEIITAIEKVVKGETYYSATIASRVLQASTTYATIDSLTPREREILTRIAGGLSNKRIAQELDLSVRTVETHRLNIKRKLNIEGQAKLIKFAIANELE
ncbi:response regulator [Candidatus Pandoraea novymonadis]|uniref:Oxygen regulatory protein NreC n=1 Tax=Candidatus Pandoraea novymonadis TaxID=1808959 RepID=A0ABX5FGQ8_9BURK|nr:response regulator transcription factor [Candidatus Pandoraea novymonadis]PSB92446.1 Oxygen regulatory protein NreC [Candidatus Pandoraea novymonadis]